LVLFKKVDLAKEERKASKGLVFITNANGVKKSLLSFGSITIQDVLKILTNLNMKLLPVSYFSQFKAWMTGDILDRILKKINQSLRAQSQFIALLMDNVGCHTTSQLQPLNLRIIKNFKFHYRHNTFLPKLKNVILHHKWQSC